MRHLLAAIFSSTLLAASGCTVATDVGCVSDDECRFGRVCDDGRCVGGEDVPSNNGTNGDEDGPSNNGPVVRPDNNRPDNNRPDNNRPDNNRPDNNRPDNNRPINNPTNNEPENNSFEDPFLVCERLCFQVFQDCVAQQCGPEVAAGAPELVEQCMFEGIDGGPGCVEALQAEPDAIPEVLEFLADLTCDSDEVRDAHCSDPRLRDVCPCGGAGNGTGEVGDSCEDNSDCVSTGLPGFCLAEDGDPSFDGGYCTAFGCFVDPQDPRASEDPACGDGNICVPVGEAREGVCFDGCARHDACRDDYQCRLVGFEREGFGRISALRVCLPECDDDAECGGNERCFDGECRFQCEDGGGMGPSARERCSLLGFTCTPGPDGREWCEAP